MALHESYSAMLKESLEEMIAVVDYCISSQKNRGVGLVPGCYGYPSAILLLSIVDTIGSFVIGRKTERNFQVLNDPKYYGLTLDAKAVRAIYAEYRNNLTHTSVLGLGFYLDKGQDDSAVYEEKDGCPCLNVVPFLQVSKGAVSRFLAEANQIVLNSRVFKNLVAEGRLSQQSSVTTIDMRTTPASGIGPLEIGSGTPFPREDSKEKAR